MDGVKRIIKVLSGPDKLPTLKQRTNFLTNLSLMPCLICYLAFTRPFVYRYFGAPKTLQGVDLTCSKFGWLNNASIRMTCNNRPLDIHASLAISWLSLFTIQTLLRKFHFDKAHKFVGKYLGWVAVVNVVGMIQLAVYDVVSPMVTERPPVFTPFMFMTAVIVFGCLYMSWQGLRASPMNVDQHTLWMCRAFLMSFTTPVIRFYPIVLRYIFSTACIKAQQSLDTWVIGSMTVASTLTLYLFWLANKACLDEPVDLFLKGFLAFEVGALLIDMQQHLTKGSFFGHMYQCFKDGDNGPTIFDGMPVHPLAIFGFVIALTVWVFFLLMDGETPDEEDEETTEKTGLLRN